MILTKLTVRVVMLVIALVGVLAFAAALVERALLHVILRLARLTLWLLPEDR